MTNSAVTVRVPASTANLGPGFDTLGMALSKYLYVKIETSSVTSIRMYGDCLNGLPDTKQNLIYQVAQKLFHKVGFNRQELSIDVYSEIPLTRGMGSSAAAIVAALSAANALSGSKLGKDDLFQMATELEGHPDNVGAALFGGIIVSQWDGIQARYIKLVPPPALECLLVIPEFQLSTEKARTVIPKQTSLQDAVSNISSSSLLVAALASGRLDLIRYGMKDLLHQPYRAQLVPGMSQILEEAYDAGALGVALSGAGPTLLALVDQQSPQKKDLENLMKGTLLSNGVQSDHVWLLPDSEGAKIMAEDSIPEVFGSIKGERKS